MRGFAQAVAAEQFNLFLQLLPEQWQQQQAKLLQILPRLK